MIPSSSNGARLHLLLYFLLASIGNALCQPATYVYARHYVEGQVDRYELRTKIDGTPTEEVGISLHRAVTRDNIPYESVRWASLTDTAGGDYSDAARKMPEYDLSLHPMGLPRLVKPKDNPKMMGPVTDLYTFLFAISPLAGITKLNKPGDRYVRPDLLTGDWSNGNDVLVGQDRTELHLKLISTTPDAVVYESAFLPPRNASLTMRREWMQPPVCESPNNFQMVRRQGPGFLVIWGCEEYTVLSKIIPSSGKISSAQMDNRLRWKMKFCNDPDLTKCVDQPNLTRRRIVNLTLTQTTAPTEGSRPPDNPNPRR